MKKTVDAQLIRDILASFGFAEERIDTAVHDLFAESVNPVTTPPIDRILTFKQTCELLSLSKSGLRRVMDARRTEADLALRTPPRLSPERHRRLHRVAKPRLTPSGRTINIPANPNLCR